LPIIISGESVGKPSKNNACLFKYPYSLVAFLFSKTSAFNLLSRQGLSEKCVGLICQGANADSIGTPGKIKRGCLKRVQPLFFVLKNWRRVSDC
jgi:hypothetical protein